MQSHVSTSNAASFNDLVPRQRCDITQHADQNEHDNVAEWSEAVNPSSTMLGCVGSNM